MFYVKCLQLSTVSGHCISSIAMYAWMQQRIVIKCDVEVNWIGLLSCFKLQPLVSISSFIGTNLVYYMDYFNLNRHSMLG